MRGQWQRERGRNLAVGVGGKFVAETIIAGTLRSNQINDISSIFRHSLSFDKPNRHSISKKPAVSFSFSDTTLLFDGHHVLGLQRHDGDDDWRRERATPLDNDGMYFYEVVLTVNKKSLPNSGHRLKGRQNCNRSRSKTTMSSTATATATIATTIATLREK